jgi:HPt (histidine-containing phosphotransfer) domain-containing protein
MCRIRSAGATGGDEAAEAAHRLCGLASYLGLPALAAETRALEASLKVGAVQDPRLLDHLADTVSRSKEALLLSLDEIVR